jgi:hypothetical protein
VRGSLGATAARTVPSGGRERPRGAAVGRRRVLTVSATLLPLLATASCGEPNPLTGPPPPSPQVRTLQAAIAAERALVGAYTRVLAAHPALSGSLRPLLTQHEDHLAQLRGRLIEPPRAAASPSASARPGHSPAQRLPATAGGAVTFLEDMERSAAAAGVRRLAHVTPSLAQLLASIAASEATHAAALSALRPAGGA